MADEIQESPAPSAELSSKDEERVSVASNWKLVWWRFRKNRLAVASAIVLLIFYAVVLVPDFFSNQDPEATDAALAFIPMQWIAFFDDDWIQSFGAGSRRQAQSGHAEMEWSARCDGAHPDRALRAGLQVQGAGSVRDRHPSDRRQGPEVQGAAAFPWAPTGWGATSGRA